MTLHFGHLDALHWLWAIAALAGLTWWGLRAHRRRLAAFAADAVRARLLRGVSAGRRLVRAGLVLAGLLLIVAAMLDPRWGVSYEEVKQQGIDIVVVLDVSRSMRAEDVRPDRLERAKRYVLDLVETLGGDRVGLVTFAGTASLACPLTVDYGAFALSLLEAGPELIGRGGSLLGDGLRLAGESFTDELREYKAILVVSDGEDHGSYPLEAARGLWEDKGVRVYTVGLGDASTGARIPVEPGRGRHYLVHEGQEIWSKMNPALLRDLALAGGGAYVPAGTSDVDLARIYEERIAPATKREFGTTRIQRRHVRYQWFAGLALALLLAESLIGDGRREGAAAGAMRRMKRRMRNGMRATGQAAATAALAVAMLAMTPPAPTDPPPIPSLEGSGLSEPLSGAEIRELIDSARRAVELGRHELAIERYRRLRQAMPGSAAVPYNMGIAQYRAGDVAGAAESFAEAADLAAAPDLRSKSLFNLGNAAYRQSLDALQGGGDPAEASAALQDATGRLREALGHYKDAIESDPNDEDARANAELAWRLMKQLEQMQQQQNQDQGQDQSQDQSQDQNQDQPDQQDQPPDQNQDPNENQNQNQNQDQQQQDQQSGQDREQPSGPIEAPPQPQDQEPQEQPLAAEAEADERMSEEQAERLLQMVRDKERTRREELARRAAADRKPVTKDW